jgi:hypothetical protein
MHMKRKPHAQMLVNPSATPRPTQMISPTNLNAQPQMLWDARNSIPMKMKA